MTRRVRNISSTPVALYDEVGNPVTAFGLAAGATVSVAGSNLAESTQTEADAVANVHTFAAVVGSIEIYNRDTENELVAVVNGVTIRVPPGTPWEPTVILGTPSAEVTVTGSTSYYINRYT